MISQHSGHYGVKQTGTSRAPERGGPAAAQPSLLDLPAELPRRCGPSCRPPSPSQAHCGSGGCHRTFGSVSDFDRHRRVGACVDPAALGLVERDGLWASAEGHARRELDGARLRRSRRFPGLVVDVEPRTADAGPLIPSKINNADLTLAGASGPGVPDVAA